MNCAICVLIKQRHNLRDRLPHRPFAKVYRWRHKIQVSQQLDLFACVGLME